MNQKIIWGVIIILILGSGVYFYTRDDGSAMEKDAMMKDDSTMLEKTEMNQENDVMSKMEDTMMKMGSYEAYTPSKISLATDTHDVVLFFRASWCPTCKVVDADIREHLSEIPEHLTILDVDYDNSSDLKKKYGVTYQHTFVQVDTNGNMIKKWSGSPTLKALVSEVK